MTAAPNMTDDIHLTDYETRPKWLAARMHGIGASESAALFGVSPHHTKLKLWSEKVGLLPPDDLSGKEYIDWGTILEPTIAERYAEITGRTIWQGGPYCVAQHPRLPMMFATPDRWVIDAPDRGSPGLLQAKNAGAYTDRDWADGPPDFIQIQVQHEMAVTGREWDSVAVLIGGNKFKYFDVERNQSFIDELEQQIQWFWQTVELRQQPSADELDARSLETIKRLHPADNGQEVELPPAALEWWGLLDAARKAGSAAEKAKADADAKLRAAIGDATFAVLPDGRRLSLKTTSRSGFSVEPTTFRSLRLEKDKRPWVK